MQRKVAWHKVYNYEVPYNPLLEGVSELDIFLADESFDAAAYAKAQEDPAPVVVADEPEPATEEFVEVDPIEILVEAMGLLERGNPKHFTKAGLPNSMYLSDICNMRVSNKMRDEAWEIFNQ